MKVNISVITLPVFDLQKSLAFYRDGIGLETDGIRNRGSIHSSVVFDLQDGLQLLLLPHEVFEQFSHGHPIADGAIDSILSFMVDDKTEHDRIVDRVEAMGGKLLPSVGGTTYFKDPDGHIWEMTT
jgi:catechol 2,3-dioxygenase-like lactoylglutathione lyase family enzyme